MAPASPLVAATMTGMPVVAPWPAPPIEVAGGPPDRPGKDRPLRGPGPDSGADCGGRSPGRRRDSMHGESSSPSRLRVVSESSPSRMPSQGRSPPPCTLTLRPVRRGRLAATAAAASRSNARSPLPPLPQLQFYLFKSTLPSYPLKQPDPGRIEGPTPYPLPACADTEPRSHSVPRPALPLSRLSVLRPALPLSRLSVLLCHSPASQCSGLLCHSLASRFILLCHSLASQRFGLLCQSLARLEGRAHPLAPSPSPPPSAARRRPGTLRAPPAQALRACLSPRRRLAPRRAVRTSRPETSAARGH